jgi:hypothetical protein
MMNGPGSETGPETRSTSQAANDEHGVKGVEYLASSQNEPSPVMIDPTETFAADYDRI